MHDANVQAVVTLHELPLGMSWHAILPGHEYTMLVVHPISCGCELPKQPEEASDDCSDTSG